MALTLRAAGCRSILNSRSICRSLTAPCSVQPAFPLLSAHTASFSNAKQSLLPSDSSLTTSHHHSASRFRNFVTRAADGDAPAVSVAEAPAPEVAAKPAAETSPVELLDFRVGRVLKAWKHPEADGLYVEEVDVGEEAGPRTIVSGLVGYVPLEEMQDRPVVVFANLKPRNMRGIKSNGMLVAASNAEHTVVELVTPPADAQPGERIWFGGEEDSSQAAPAGANQVQKKKIWEAVQPKLNTSEGLEARFEERVMRTSAGPCTVKSLKGASLA